MNITDRQAGETGSNGLAIATMCAGIACLVLNDAMAKWLTAHYTPLQIVFMRNLLAMPMVAALALAMVGPAGLRTNNLRLHALRGLLLVGGAFTFFLGLASLPLAEATSLVFAAPIFITALSVPMLGERVGLRRWAAVIVGFAGVLVIVRPGATAFEPASLYPVATAMIYAVVMISARWIDRREGVWTMMFYVVLFPMLFSGLAAAADFQTPRWPHLPLFIGMAIFGTLGMTFITQAFRMAPASVVAPFDYTALIWASLFGWLVWREIPDMWTYVGAATIIASGIYILVRETRRGDRPA